MDKSKKTVNYCWNCLRFNPNEYYCLYHNMRVEVDGVCFHYLESFENETEQ